MQIILFCFFERHGHYKADIADLTGVFPRCVWFVSVRICYHWSDDIPKMADEISSYFMS